MKRASFLAVAIIGAAIVALLGSGALAQSVVSGAPDPETAGVYLFTAGTDSGEVGACTGTPGGSPTDDIIQRAIDADALIFIGDSTDEILSFTPGSALEMPAGQVNDTTIAEATQGLTAIDDFGAINNGDDNSANADIGNGGSITLRLPEGFVIMADGVAASGALANGTDAVANLDGFEIFLFEDAEMSGMIVTVNGPQQQLTFDIADLQLNPNTASAADDMLLAIDLDTLGGWTDAYVESITFTDDGVSQGATFNCPFSVPIDTSVEIDAVATRSELLVLTPSISIEKTTNGEDADTGTGPILQLGDPVTWAYVVTNDGEQPLTDIAVADNPEGLVTCPQTSLAVGESMTCTPLTGTATTVGTYENTVTVVAMPESGGQIVGTDPSHYTVLSEPSMTLEKLVNGEDADAAPGPSLAIGSTATWTYTVTNTGNVVLSGINVTDDREGAICLITELAPGASDSCTATATVTEGAYVNVGTASAMDPFGTTVTATDPANHIGESADLTIEKRTNDVVVPAGATGPTLAVGDAVTWTYTVFNGGTVALTDVVVTDSVEGAVCTIAVLPAGGNDTCQLSGVAGEGQYTNEATATGVDPFGTTLTSSDTSAYFGVTSGLSLDKLIDGAPAPTAPGPVLPSGSTATFTFVATNTGNSELTNVSITDDVFGAICTLASLAPGANGSCDHVGTIPAGQHTNTGTATGTDPLGGTVSASAVANAFGSGPGITIEKSTNGSDSDAAPGLSIAVGAPVEWTYTITNVGNVDLVSIVVTDDVAGPVCTRATLAVDEVATCAVTGVAVVGEYVNIGTVTAETAQGTAVTADDPSHYTGVVGAVGDLVWLDVNRNGIQDDGDPGIEGVQVYLLASVGDPITSAVQSTTTDAAGRYLFEMVDPGQYEVVFVAPDGEDWTVANATDDALDSDADANGRTGAVTVPAGGANVDVDAGILPPEPGSIGDTVWFDLDGDGVVDDDEPGINGVTVELLVTDPVSGLPAVLESAITANDGQYLFDTVVPGDYVIRIDASTLPDGAFGVYELDGVIDGSTTETLDEAEDALNHDFGFQVPGLVGDFIWEDLNGNGVQDEGEPGIGDVTLRLWTVDADGTPLAEVARTTTDESGFYQFTGLDPNVDYVIQLSPPTGWVVTSFRSGTNPAFDNDFADTGLTPVFSLDSGESRLSIDGGLLRSPARIGDFVFMDLDGDGIQDAGEGGVAGAEVTLWSIGADGAPETAVATQTTGDDGLYLFTDVDPDNQYVVQVTLPDGWTLSPADSGDDDTVDSDVDPTTGISGVISPAPGSENLTIDIGVRPRVAGIELVVLTDGIRVDDGLAGPSVPAGTEVEISYTATNTGDWDLTNVAISDPIHGEICVIPFLAVGASETCTHTAVAEVGLEFADASVVGTPVDADRQPATQLDGTAVALVRDEDPLEYEGTTVLAATTVPTATPVPPTATPVPPTSTPVPPTSTPVPTSTPAPQQPLAITGSNSSDLAVTAVALIVIGGGMVVLGTRRRDLYR